MFYRKKAARALQSSHPDFWHQLQVAAKGSDPMLLGFWHFHLKQAMRKGIDPDRAAASFVKAATRPQLH